MNRATDEDVRSWSDRHGIDGRSVSELRDAFEDAQSFAAADTLLARRQVTREAIVATADAAESDWKHDAARGRAGGTLCDYIANAIADLFGVTE